MQIRTWIAVSILLLTACTADKQPATAEFRVALLSPGPVSDGGWNAQAYAGLLRIRDELAAEVSQVETHNPAEFEEAFRDYARQGYKLVFGHGFEYQDAAALVGPEFPETVFITTAGNRVLDNVAPIVFQLEQATFLAGYLAARMSKSGRIGAVGGMRIPPVERTFAAFENGARLASPDVEFTTSYIGNWEDVGAARQAALALMDQGADLLIHNADAAASGVFQAAGERGVFVFGTNKDQNSIAPETILASCASDIPAAFLEMGRTVRDGSFEGRIHSLGMAEGVVSFIINPVLRDRIPGAVLEEVEKVRGQIVAGEIDVLSKE